MPSHSLACPKQENSGGKSQDSSRQDAKRITSIDETTEWKFPEKVCENVKIYKN
jgi:hypothetical protein